MPIIIYFLCRPKWPKSGSAVSQSVSRSLMHYTLDSLPIHPSRPFSTARTHALHFQPLEATATTQQLLPRHTPRIYWKVGARSLHKLRNRTRIKPCLHLIKRCGACLCVECRRVGACRLHSRQPHSERICRLKFSTQSNYTKNERCIWWQLRRPICTRERCIFTLGRCN